MKVSELTGGLLDFWVAKAEGIDVLSFESNIVLIRESTCWSVAYEPSTEWAQGGPILEDNAIGVIAISDAEWMACEQQTHCQARGPSYLVAAMRAYVMHKFGDEVNE